MRSLLSLVFHKPFWFLLIFCVGTVFSQPWTLPRDAQGWSVLNPSADSRIIYVSSSEGNDATAEFYSTAQIGNNPRQPAVTVKPYQSIQAAIEQIRDGYPDWVLLKTGDTWTYEMLQLHDIGQGRSPQERIVFTWYGSGDQRPVIQTDGNGIRSWGKNYANLHQGIHFWAFVGIEFYNNKADPLNSDYSSAVTHTQGTSLSAGGSYLLFEDCKFNYLEIIVQGVDRNWEQVEIRRNIVVDTYYINSCNDRPKRPSGIFAKHIVNLLLEENTFDHNGWSEHFPNSGRNAYNHNLYMSWEIYQDVISRGNINSRASGNAAQWRGGAHVEKNLYIQGPAGVFVGHENGNAASVAVKDNVVLEGITMGDCSQATSATWGITLDQDDFAAFNTNVPLERNIVAHHLNYPARTALEQEGAGVMPADNIVYKWNESEDIWNDNWLDPERSVGSYHATIGGQATTESFIEEARNRKLNQWPEEYSAYSVINYIREGFNMTPVSATSAVVSVTGISFAQTSMQIAGETVKLVPQISPEDATYQSVTWSSSDSTVAIADYLGNVTGLSAGTATITATTADGDFTASVEVTVVDIPVSSISLSASEVSLFEEQKLKINATVLPTDAFDLSVNWTSRNTSVFTVETDGTVSGVAPGEAWLVATTNSGGLKDSALIRVYSIIPENGWAETFADLANGTTVDNGTTAWSLSATGLSSAATLEVTDGALHAQELGAEATLTTETINFQDSATLVVDWEATGYMEDTDYMRAYYILDGGSEVLFGEYLNIADRNIATTTVYGSSVQVVVKLLNTGGNEDHYIHNIVVGTVEIPVQTNIPAEFSGGTMNIQWNAGSKYLMLTPEFSGDSRSSGSSAASAHRNQPVHVQLFSLNGELSYSRRLNSAEAGVDLSALQPGIYYVKVVSPYGVFSQKIVNSR